MFIMAQKIVESLKELLGFGFNIIPAKIMKKIMGFLSIHHALQDKWGFYIRPIHYYEPLPNFSEIKVEKIFHKRISDCIDWRLERMLENLKSISVYQEEISQSESKQFGGVDGAFYYAMIRYLKPSKIIEIGAGYSTEVASWALAKNQQEGKLGKIVCIEPYPQPILTDGNLNVEILTERVENVDNTFFAQLQAGDILFIDSTHTVKFNSDVCKEILEILPMISGGVYIHFHDIFLPYDYPPEWLIDRRMAWNEQYMLEAFLAYNSNFDIVLANHWLSVDYPEKVAELYPDILNWSNPYHHCGSFWIYKK